MIALTEIRLRVASQKMANPEIIRLGNHLLKKSIAGLNASSCLNSATPKENKPHANTAAIVEGSGTAMHKNTCAPRKHGSRRFSSDT